MENLAIVKYIKTHGLNKAINDFKLKSRDYGHKIMLKYDQIESPMGLLEVQECRGLILEKDTWEVMCLSFIKFFNNQEGHASKIDWSTALILEKLDGSMIQVYWDWVVGDWFAATTGTGNGEGEVNNKYNTTFNDLFWETLDTKYELSKSTWTKIANKDKCFVFELTTPYNIVVKPHPTSSVTLLTIRDIPTLEECSYNTLVNTGYMYGLPVVKTFTLSNGSGMQGIGNTFEGMPWYEEGYVVVDAKHNRNKCKNPAYVAVHHTKSKSALHNILEIIKSNEIDEFGATFPDRLEEMLELKIKYDSLIERLEGVWAILSEHKPKNISKEEAKKFASKVFSFLGDDVVLKRFSGLFFNLKDGRIGSVKEYILNYDNRDLYNLIK